MKEWTGEAISMKGFEHISFSVKERESLLKD